MKLKRVTELSSLPPGKITKPKDNTGEGDRTGLTDLR